MLQSSIYDCVLPKALGKVEIPPHLKTIKSPQEALRLLGDPDNHPKKPYGFSGTPTTKTEAYASVFSLLFFWLQAGGFVYREGEDYALCLGGGADGVIQTL